MTNKTIEPENFNPDNIIWMSLNFPTLTTPHFVLPQICDLEANESSKNK